MLTIACSLAAFTPSAKAQVLADGAAGADALYEQGSLPYWYIEEQRVGADDIIAGIHQENPTLISEGLLILNWGFNREGADGSYPGTGDGTPGEPYHSTSMFVEAAARAMIALKSYHPVTYTLASGTYTSTIAQDTQDIHLSAEWLTGATDPSVPVVGKQYDSPYTHRRYLLGAALQESAVLTGDTSLTTVANTYIDAGLALQLPNGWTASLTKNKNETYPPATLVAPGKPLPAGTVESFSAGGVNPENNGYDVNYQAFGLTLAEYWYNNSPSSARKTAVKTMLTNGLDWEENQVESTGEVNPLGNSRVGLETAPDGQIKTISYPLISGAFLQSVPILGSKFDVIGTRVAEYDLTVSSTPRISDGAAGSNIAYDENKSTSWEIGQQASAADWITAGVATNNPDYVNDGISIFNWGWSRQSSNGSFGTSADLCFGTVQFVEAASRSMLMLKSFNASKYASTISSYSTKIKSACAWLTGSEAARVQSALSQSVADEYAAAACLAEASAVTGTTALNGDAEPYAETGLSMQLSSGENPEAGAADPNWQGIGVQYAEWYYPYAPKALQSSLESMMTSALDWEMGYVDVDGDVSGQPAIRSIGYAFSSGASITGQPQFQVVANRIFNL